jgi:hypothetical protein
MRTRYPRIATAEVEPNGMKPPTGLHWRYGLRLALVPRAARIAARLGYAWDELGRRYGREVMIGQAGALPAPAAVAPAETPLDVVFVTMLAGNQRIAGTEIVLARALKARGHRVRMVVCDQALPVCEVMWEGKEAGWQQACAKCYGFGVHALRAAGLEVLSASQLADEAPPAADGDDGERWSETVESALLKHYRVGVLDDSAAVAERRGLFADAAGRSAAIGRRIAEMRPDRVVMSHGIYCTWGPQRQILEDAGIPLVTYAEGKKKDTVKFNWTTSADWWDVSAEWERVGGVPLDPAQEKRIDDYLMSRRSHANDARVYNFGEEESRDETFARLGLDPAKPTFVLFTNVLWDAASAQREIAFSNPVEWVLETIAWFREHPERQLVVKIHPAEVVIGTKQPFASLLARHFDRLPPNVRVIRPDEKVNSWSILRIATLGLVHTSTVGMELPLEGVPCAVVSRTHFRGRGFTIDVESREEYFALLEGWESTPEERERQRELAKRYSYLLFERYQLPFPFLVEATVNDVRAFRQVEAEELLAHPTIQVFLAGIESRGDAFLLPG